MRIRKSSWMQWAGLGVATAAIVGGFGFSARRAAVQAAGSESRQPVLVELFTSEGCSSCPPADALLERLDRTQPVPGAQVVVLSEHVTYWNSLGWRDPFSLDAMTERQRRYSEQFGLSDVYTPQAVVDGASELVGSDERGLLKAIAKAAARPGQELTLADARLAGGLVQFSVRTDAPSNGRLMAAVAEDSAQSAVSRGENEGRTLRHVAVVRALEVMPKGAEDGRPLTLRAPTGSYSGPLRLVVFLTDRESGRVLAVAERTLSPLAGDR